MLPLFSRFKSEAPVLYRGIVLLLILEVCGVFIAPLVVPQEWYVSSYIGEKARKATELFLSGQAMLIPDDITGWKNRPDIKRGNWRIDAEGSRSTHAVVLEKSRKRRVLFLGSSMMNGGTAITNDETISAYVEDANTESANFGTMLFTLDQCLLAYRYSLNRYKPDVLVVGIDELPMNGLQNMFIPFRNHEETNMPFLKPRFELKDGSLRLVRFAPNTLATLAGTPAVLDTLSRKDFYYYNYESYRRFGFLPLSYGLRSLYIKCINFLNYFADDRQSDLLAESLMNDMVSEARQNGARVIFLVLPDKKSTAPSGVYRYLPDVQGNKMKHLIAEGFTIIDGREIFRKSGRAESEIFQADEKHYKPAANRMIAEVLRKSIN